ncbi:hypothetical protein AB1Y20_012187 [Prymnesium parvum]
MSDAEGVELAAPAVATSTTVRPPLNFVPGTSIPVLIFLNSASGGRQGGRLLRLFQQWLGEAQVHDLATVRQGGPSPEAVLRRYEGVEGLRVIACGGDGTCCWVLTALANVPGCQAAVGTMPLGTGNDFSRALGWGSGLTRAMRSAKWLQKVAMATAVPFDRWSVSVSTPAEPMPPTFVRADSGVVGTWQNYLGIGIEAAAIHAFHVKREANPEAFNGRLKNQAKMGLLGVGKSGLCPLACGAAPQLAPRLVVKVRHRGKTELEPLPLPRRLKAFVLVNIPSHAAGRNLWGAYSSSDGGPQSYSDGLIEVVGFHSASHFGAYLACNPLCSIRATGSTRLCQVEELRIELLEPLHIQMDGEPWLQPAGSIHIQHHSSPMVLRAPKGKVTYPPKEPPK